MVYIVAVKVEEETYWLAGEFMDLQSANVLAEKYLKANWVTRIWQWDLDVNYPSNLVFTRPDHIPQL